MNLAAAILYRALNTPDQPALATARGVATYGDLASATFGCARRLDQLGLEAGAIVALGVRDIRAHLALILACELRGLVSVSVQTEFTVEASGLHPRLLLTDEVPDAAPRSAVEIIDMSWLEAHAGTDARRELQEAPEASDRMSRIILSSGSTGVPKAIGLTAGDLQLRAFLFGLRGGSVQGAGRWTSMMGISTLGGFTVALDVLLTGGLLGFANSARDTLALVRAFALDGLLAAPGHLQALVNASGGRTPVLPLQRIMVGGSRVQGDLLLAAQSCLTSNIWVIYGSTEVSVVANGPATQLSRIDGGTGYVVPWARVEIVDEADRPLPPEREGIVRSRSNTMGRYVGDHAEGDQAFRGGWFYPGDVGLMRRDGLLVITGRTNELINAGGAKLAPELLEQVLLQHPAVRDAAVFAVPDLFGVPMIWAAVVRGAAVDEATLVRHCRQLLPSASPARILWVAEVPRNQGGKVMREALKEKAAGLAETPSSAP